MTANDRRGVAAMIAGMAGFVGNDALVKFTAETMPVSQVIFVRSLIATGLLLILAVVLRARLVGEAISSRRVLARIVLDALACILFFTGIVHMPFANAAAINMSTPLIITAIAAIFLREKLSVRGRVAVCIGFTGVLLVVQPAGKDFNAWSLLILLSAVLAAIRDLITRAIHERITAIQIALVFSAALVPISVVWGLFDSWGPVAARDVALIALASVSVTVGFVGVTTAMRTGAVDAVIPFRYSAVVFAALVGFVVWGDLPNAWAWVGMTTIVLSGIWLLRVR